MLNYPRMSKRTKGISAHPAQDSLAPAQYTAHGRGSQGGMVYDQVKKEWRGENEQSVERTEMQ